MRRSTIQRYGVSLVIMVPILFALIALGAQSRASEEHRASPTEQAVVALSEERGLSDEVAPTVTVATVTPEPSPNPSPVPTVMVVSTPTTEVAIAPRVGIQVGHWKTEELPDELARLRTSVGAVVGEYTEVDVNMVVAEQVAAQLQNEGITVDLLPATIPPAYEADAFISIHADGSTSTATNGFKLATSWRTSRASQQLHDAIRTEYATATGLPWDSSITVNMRGYYAFSYYRFTHTVARTTPSVIVEMGFLTNPADRALMLNEPERVASGITQGILRYLSERDPNDREALIPPEFKTQRSRSAEGVTIRSRPDENASSAIFAPADARIRPFEERDGWYQVFVRVGEERAIGWVQKELVVETDDPIPTPLPPLDS